MNKRTLTSIGASLILPLALALPSMSQAAFVSCTGNDPVYDLSGRVTPSTDCAILAPLNGNDNDHVSGTDPSLWTVNAESFFGFSDWLFDGKWQEADGIMNNDGATLASFDGGPLSGGWSLADPDFWANHEHLMFVFKDGGNTNLTAYLIETGATGGTYLSPFSSPPFPLTGAGNDRDISHISIYYRGEGDVPPSQIPEPGLMMLFGTGILAMGWAVRRRNRMDSTD